MLAWKMIRGLKPPRGQLLISMGRFCSKIACCMSCVADHADKNHNVWSISLLAADGMIMARF
jgi:hypothetical protein